MASSFETHRLAMLLRMRSSRRIVEPVGLRAPELSPLALKKTDIDPDGSRLCSVPKQKPLVAQKNNKNNRAPNRRGLFSANLIWLNGKKRSKRHGSNMKISEILCPACDSSYLVAEAAMAGGSPGHVQCVNCGGLLAYWTEPSRRVYRLERSTENKYARVPAPPSPNATAA